jgi:hypothetical protein
MIEKALKYIIEHPEEFKLTITADNGSEMQFEGDSFSLLIQFVGPLTVFSIYEGEPPEYRSVFSLPPRYWHSITSQHYVGWINDAVNRVSEVVALSPELKQLLGD